MEWDPTERDAWVIDAERWIGQIKGVLQCKIDLDDDGVVCGVHVVAGMEREPRHIVRDVEGLLKARVDMDVYYKKIGVVQVVDNGALAEVEAASETVDLPAAPAAEVEAAATATATLTAETEPIPDELPEPRPAILVAEGLGSRVTCTGVGVMASDTLVSAEVILRSGQAEVRGVREAPNHAGSDVRMVAEATLAALAELVTDPVLLHLREVRLDAVGDQQIVLAAVDLVEGRRTEVLFGSCAAGHNRQQAVVHAVLDALNRRLALLSLHQGEFDAASS